jgi:uncharacterized protein (DUF983 family)
MSGNAGAGGDPSRPPAGGAGPDGAAGDAAPPPVTAALKGLCPRCGAPGLYAGVARFAPRCRRCGLDFAGFNVGDGPAAFLTLILGTIVTVLAIALELSLGPPVWVHLILWPIVTTAGVIASLRVAKAWLLALEYRNAAHEGRIAP